jgi:hypothetical protein
VNDELMDLGDIAALYKCSRRHARDVITKWVGFPEIAPGSSPRNPLWLRVEVRAFLHRKRTKDRTNYEQKAPAPAS